MFLYSNIMINSGISQETRRKNSSRKFFKLFCPRLTSGKIAPSKYRLFDSQSDSEFTFSYAILCNIHFYLWVNVIYVLSDVENMISSSNLWTLKRRSRENHQSEIVWLKLGLRRLERGRTRLRIDARYRGKCDVLNWTPTLNMIVFVAFGFLPHFGQKCKQKGQVC